MELLSRVVPAIRETRTPLVVGYLWLYALWMAVVAILAGSGHDLTDSIVLEALDPTGVWGVRGPVNILGGAGLLATVSFMAYMLGSGADYLVDLILRPIDSRVLRDRTARLFAEAQLRIQSGPPLAIGIDLTIYSLTPDFFERQVLDLSPDANGLVPLLLLVGVLTPGPLLGWLLLAHGWKLWQIAVASPVRPNLDGEDLSAGSFRHANFDHCSLVRSNLQAADFTGASMREADLSEAKIAGAIFDDVDLMAPRVTVRQEYLGLVKSLKGAKLQSAELHGVDLTSPELTGINLSQADLSAADLRWTDLTSADLSGASLDEIKLVMPKLNRAKLRRVSLPGIELEFLKAHGADLSGANLCEAKLRGSDLRCVDMSWAKLRGADLSDADLRGADLSHCDLTGANLARADLGIGICDYRPVRSSLRGAKLTESNLVHANLSGADLTDAELGQAGLADANLRGALIENIADRSELEPIVANIENAKFEGTGFSERRRSRIVVAWLTVIAVAREVLEFWLA